VLRLGGAGDPLVERGSAIIRYRDFVVRLVSRSVKAFYSLSILGVAWTRIRR
jgi:ABC-type polysaccharide/polyol phosphate export permease